MNRTAVEEIKARIPIDELVGSYVKLEKAGKSLKARCPFHNEKSASFFVSPDRGGYYCFGCGAKGDIFTFVEQFEGLDFRGALKVLAEKAGVPLHYDDKGDGERDRLFKIMEEATTYFEAQYERSKEVAEYVRGRGISPDTRLVFRIGYAPEGWKNLFTYLKGKGWNESFIEKAGLAKKGDKGDSYDRFRGRVIFPITDSSGRVIAFTGRILPRLDDGKSAKYLNSPDTPLFDKSQVLFGLDKAKSEIRRLNYSILVEGQMDLVLSHQVGVKNAVAASGTALAGDVQGDAGTVTNLGMVRRLSPNMIIALDSDKAGKTAAMRAVAATALGMGMSVKIADIQGGKDPADLILHNPEDWKNVLKNAKHVVEYELGNITSEITDPHKLPRAVKERLFPYLLRMESEMDKSFYVKMIADKTGISELSIWEDLRKAAKEQAAAGTKNSASGTYPSSPLPAPRSQLPAPSSSLLAPNSHLPTSNSMHRIDLVERRMFGLLNLMETAKLPLAADYREEIRKIAADSYEEYLKRIAPIESDLAFEAEVFFGNDQSRYGSHMNELLANFEEDLVNEDLLSTMGKLRAAEQAGKSAEVSELAKKCQVLSIRKAEIVKRRR